MDKCLLLLLFLSASYVLSAQESTFEYYRKGKYVQMSSGKTIIGFDGYKRNVSGVKERPVQSKGVNYRLVIQDGKSGKVKTIVNSKDSVLATVFLSGENRNAILLPDGRMFIREKLGYDHWRYQKDGDDVMTYTLHQDGKMKSVIVQCHNETVPLEVLQIICLEHSAEMLYNNPTVAMIGVAVGLALLRVITAAGS
ncbi:MAG: hypothetical protein ABI663_03445 [Chryseolinea sp.]